MTNDPTIQVVDNSDLDLTGVPLTKPIIDKQWVKVRITNLYWQELESTKTVDKKAKQLVIQGVTEEAATSTDGRVVNPGEAFEVTIYATPVGGLTQLMINQKLGRFQVAALGLTEPTKFGPPDQYVGKVLKGYFEAEAGRQDSSILYQRINRWEKV